MSPSMGLVRPLFVASIALLTLMMTSMGSTIQLLRQMGILVAVGTCSNCSSSTGTREAVQLLPLQFAICKKKQSLLQDTVLSNSNTASHDFKYMETHLSWKYHQEVLLFPNALNEGMTWAWRCSTSSTASAARQFFGKRQTFCIMPLLATVCSFYISNKNEIYIFVFNTSNTHQHFGHLSQIKP